MKKLVTGILAMLLCFGCLAGCGDTTNTSSSTPDASTPNASTPDASTPDESTPDEPSEPAHPHETDLSDVKDYVYEQMAKKSLETRESFTVINTFSFIGAEEKYDIAWSVDVTEGVTIQEGEAEDTVAVVLRANGSKSLAKACDIGIFAKQVAKLWVKQPAPAEEGAVLVLGVIGGKKFADLLIRLVQCLRGKGHARGNVQIDDGIARHQPLVPLGL